MPFTKDGKWVPMNYEEMKKERETMFRSYKSYDIENRPSYETPERRPNEEGSMYRGFTPSIKPSQYDGPIGPPRPPAKTQDDNLEPQKDSVFERLFKRGRESVTEGPFSSENVGETTRKFVDKLSVNEQEIDRGMQGREGMTRGRLAPENIEETNEDNMNRFTDFFGDLFKRGREAVTEGPFSAENIEETNEINLRKFANQYEPGQTSLSEMLQRPLNTLSDTLSFGATKAFREKLGADYGEPDSFSEQVADKIGQGLGFGIGGGAVKQAGQTIAGGAVGRNVAQRGRELLGRGPLPGANPQMGRSLSQELAGLGAGTAAFGATNEFAEGWTDPEIEERNAIQEIAGNMRYGFYQNLSDLGSFANSQDWKWGDKAKSFAERSGGEEFATHYDKEFSWKSFLDPKYYTTTMAQSLPSMIATMPLGILGYGGAALAAGKLGLGAFGRTVAGAVGGASLQAPLESAMIAGGTYEEALKRGHNEEEATSIANNAFWKTMAVTAVTQSLELGAMFAPVRRFIPQVENQLANISVRAAGTGTMEGTQEVLQDWAVSSSLGDDFNLAESGESFGLGFLMGGAMGAATSFVNGEEGAFNEPGSDTVNAPNPIPGNNEIVDPNNPVRDIQRKAKELMNDEMRAEFDEEVEAYRNNGYPDDVAEVIVWESVAMTDEGKDLINRATKDVMDNKVLGEQLETEGTQTTINGETSIPTDTTEILEPTEPEEPIDTDFQPNTSLTMGASVQIEEDGELMSGTITDFDEMNGVQVAEVTFDMGADQEPYVQLYPINQLESGEPSQRTISEGPMQGARQINQGPMQDVRQVNQGPLQTVRQTGEVPAQTARQTSLNPATTPLRTGDKVTVEGREGVFTVSDLRGSQARAQVTDQEGNTFHFRKDTLRGPIQLEVGSQVTVEGQDGLYTVTDLRGDKTKLAVVDENGNRFHYNKSRVIPTGVNTLEGPVQGPQQTFGPNPFVGPLEAPTEGLEPAAENVPADNMVENTEDTEEINDDRFDERTQRIRESDRERGEIFLNGDDVVVNDRATDTLRSGVIAGHGGWTRTHSSRFVSVKYTDDGKQDNGIPVDRIVEHNGQPVTEHINTFDEPRTGKDFDLADGIVQDDEDTEITETEERTPEVEQQWKNIKRDIAALGRLTPANRVKRLRSAMDFADRYGFEYSKDRWNELIDRFSREAEENSNQPKNNESSQKGQNRNEDTNAESDQQISTEEDAISEFNRRVNSDRMLRDIMQRHEDQDIREYYNRRAQSRVSYIAQDVLELLEANSETEANKYLATVQGEDFLFNSFVRAFNNYLKDENNSSNNEMQGPINNNVMTYTLNPDKKNRIELSFKVEIPTQVEEKLNEMKFKYGKNLGFYYAANTAERRSLLNTISNFLQTRLSGGDMNALTEQVNEYYENYDNEVESGTRMPGTIYFYKDRYILHENFMNGTTPDGKIKPAELSTFSGNTRSKLKTKLNEIPNHQLIELGTLGQNLEEDIELIQTLGARRTPIETRPEPASETTENDNLQTLQEDLNDSEKLDYVFFALANNPDEIQAIREKRPKNILVSFFNWRDRNLQRDLIDKIGYRPRIIVDSGAYSFFEQNIDTRFGEVIDRYMGEYDLEPQDVISQMRDTMREPIINEETGEFESTELEEANQFLRYVDWLISNRDNFDYAVAFDSLGDQLLSLQSFDVMREVADVIPVATYGAAATGEYDLQAVQDMIEATRYYVDNGADYVALGGLSSEAMRNQRNLRIRIADEVSREFPDTNFHFLGTLDNRVIKQIPGLTSADGSAWIKSAMYSDNRLPGESRIDAAKRYMDRYSEMQRPEQTPEQPIALNEGIRILGKTTTVTTPRGTDIEVQYALVEVDDLITSHTSLGSVNPNYPSELQPRERTRQESREQVDNLARNLNPNLLGANPLATDGAPIIGPDLVVESGNGRTMALKRALNNSGFTDQRLRYMMWLSENSDNFGYTGADIESLENPVVVRLRTSDIDRVQFTDEANDSTVSRMSATEQAISDARRLSGRLMNLFVPNDNGELNTGKNRDFINAFLSEVVSPNDRNALITGNGYLSLAGIDRVRNAIFALAYGDPSAIATLAESTDNNVNNIINQLVHAAPRIAFTEQEIQQGNFHELGIREDIVRAMNELSDIRRQNQSKEEIAAAVDLFVGQMDMFGDITPITRELVRFFHQYGRGVRNFSAKNIGGTLLEYYRGIEELGAPNDIELIPPPTREQLLDISMRKVTGRDGIQADLFETEEEQDLFDDGPINDEDEPTNTEGSSTEATTGEEGGEIDGIEPAGTDGEGTLEETPSEDVQGAAEDGGTEQGAAESTGPDGGNDVSDTNATGEEISSDSTDGRGTESGTSTVPTESSVGDGEGDVDTSSGRGNNAGNRGQSNGERANQSVSRVDFQITDQLDKLGGPKPRFRNNVQALRTLREIEQDGRLATNEEQEILSRYVGWGGISQAFDSRNKSWKNEYNELRSLVEEGIISQEDYERARASTTTAFYTSKEIVQGMYTALNRLGYTKGGRILEPSVGTGNFFGLMPKSMLFGASRVGVEIDHLTARIAKQLYQRANIRNMGFEELKVSDGHFDIAIGNVPFGDTKIVDPTYKGKLAFVKSQIHNYFFIKSLDKVRDGGLVAFVTSSGTMNSSRGKKVRELIGDKADFLGAIRLPGNAFKDNANTEVTTDIIFLQKRPAGQRSNHVANFTSVEKVTVQDSDGNNVEVNNNEYFVQNPEMQLGTPAIDKLTNQKAKRLGIVSDGRNLSAALEEAINRLPENVYETRIQEVEPEEIVDTILYDMNELTEGGIGLQEGKLVQKVNGEVVKYTPKDGKTGERIRGMLPIRDLARNVLQLQRQGATDNELKAAQERLNNAYDKYVSKNGYLNEQSNRRAFSDDPVGSSLLASLEHVKETGEGKKKKTTYTKEAVFSERTVNAQRVVNTAESSEESLVVSLFEYGGVNLERMSQLTGKTEDDLIRELEGRIYMDPVTSTWITSDEYLSGNVREKLRVAQREAATDSRYQPNVEALQQVQPEDLTPNQITVRLGAGWVPETDMQDFINDLLQVEDKVKVRYLPQTAQWFVEEIDFSRGYLARNARNTSEYGIKNPRGHDRYALQLIEDSLNLRLTTITYKDPVTDQSIVDVNLTNEARQKQKEIQSIFQDWLWEEESRAERLLTEYNERFNSIRLREYDGSLVYGLDPTDSKHDRNPNRKIPGMSERYVLRPHQKDAVWRSIQGGNTLLAHVVGAGKTLEMITAGMEMKRLGFVNKPAYVVPNHLLDQWEKEFREAYPGANIMKIGSDDIGSVSVQRSQISEDFKNKKQLILGSKVTLSNEGQTRFTVMSNDFSNGKVVLSNKKGKVVERKISDINKVYRPMTDEEYEERRRLRQSERGAALNKIAVGNYDAILITHQTFQKLPVSPETTQAHIREQLADLEIALSNLRQEDGKSSRSVKALENAKKNLEAQIKENLAEENKDIAIPFEELGIDQIFVDESHMFKNLKFHTKMHNVSGLPQTNSQRAQDMYLKTQWLSQTREGKGVVFASGTPVSNTMAEMYNIQRYLQMSDLRAQGLGHFDAWASLFGESVTGTEMDTTGKFRQKTRFSRFHNVSELMTMFKSFADVKTADMLDLPTPDNVNYETILSPMSEWQEEYLRMLQGRAVLIRDGRVTPEEDNFLKLTGDGRKMALDIRMVVPEAPDFADSKVNKAVDNIVKVYKDKNMAKDSDGNTVENATQLVFLDMGTPRKKKVKDDDTEEEVKDEGVSVYEDIRNKLVQKGIPKKDIAFIHEANSDKKKEVLFNNMNEGKVRILLGSTEKMGAGMNAQRRLVALHHLDAPWRPSDVEQREGRIIRQGNMNNTVNVFSYTTEGSFDAIMWDTIRRKAIMVNQIMNGTAEVRSIEDVEAMVMGFTEIAAVTSGNPLLLEQAELQKDMLELTAAKTGHERNVREARREIREIPSRITNLEAFAADIREDVSNTVNTSGKNFRLELDGQTYLERKDAGEALIRYIEDPTLTNDLNSGEDKQIGSYAGFPLYYVKGMQRPFQIRGNRNYQFIPNVESVMGSVQRMDNALPSESDASSIDREIEQLNKNLETYRQTAERTFKQQDELIDVQRRLNDVNEQILELNADDRAVEGEEDTIDSGYSGSAGVDTFVEPITTNIDNNTTGEERRQWRNKVFEKEQEPADDRTVNRSDIVGFISQSFRVPIGTGRFKGKALAIYKRQINEIRTKHFADFVAISHELGHRLDDLYNFSFNPSGLEPDEIEVIQEELYDLAINNLNPAIINDTVPLATIRREGFAEFVRLYFDDPRQLYENTPATYEYFIERMKNETLDSSRIAPKFKKMEMFGNVETMLDALDMSAEMMDIWRDQSPEARIRGVIDVRTEQGLSLDNLSNVMKEKRVTVQHELYDSIFQELTPIDRAVKQLTGQSLNKRTLKGSQDPFVLAWNSLGVSGRIRTFIDYGVVNDQGEKIGPSLREIIEKVDDLQVFREYLVARHAKDLIKNHGKVNTPIAIKDANKRIREADENIVEAADMIYEYQESVTNELVRGGLLGTQQVDDWKLMYPFYVPFYRVMEDEGIRNEDNKNQSSSPGRRYANQRNPVRRMKDKGSARNIVDPIESIIKNTYMYLQIAERNRVGRSLADLVDKTEDSVWLMVKLDTPMYAQRFSLNEISKSLEAANIDMEYADMDQVAAVFRPMFQPKMSENELTVYRDGEPIYYKVKDSRLFNSLLALERETMNWLVRFLGGPNSLLKQSITATPDFIGRQLARSFGSTLMQSQAYKKFGGLEVINLPMDAMRNIIHLFGSKKKSDRYYKWLSGGGAGATLQELDQDYLGDSAKSILNMQKKGQTISNLKSGLNPWYAYKDYYLKYMNYVGQTFDEGFRLAEFEKRLAETGDYEKAVQASRDVDYDPSRFGNKTRMWNRMILFLNPAIQGVDKTVRTWKNQPGTTLVRGLTFLTLPTMLLMMMNEDDEDYWDLPTWRRDMFWNIPMGNGKFISIPMPFEWGWIFKVVPERLYANFKKSENVEITDPFMSMGENFVQSTIPDVLATIVGPIIEWKTGVSLQFGSPTVPMGLSDEEPKNQYNAATSELAKLIGEGFNVSPMKLDALYEGYTGTLGKGPRAFTDWLLNTTGISDREAEAPANQKNVAERIFTGFLTQSDIGSTSSVEQFYNLLEKKTGELKSLDKPGYVTPEVRMLNEAASDMATMRALKNWIVLENQTLSAEEKAEEITKIDRAIIDYARIMLNKDQRFEETNQQVFEAMQWFEEYRQDIQNQNRKEAKEEFNYDR